MSSALLWPTAPLRTQLPCNTAGTGSHPTRNGKFRKSAIFKKPALSHKPTPSPAYKRSHAQPPGASWEDPPDLCAAALVLQHKLNKVKLGTSLGFPLSSYAGDPRIPTQEICLVQISRQPVLPSVAGSETVRKGLPTLTKLQVTCGYKSKTLMVKKKKCLFCLLSLSLRSFFAQ